MLGPGDEATKFVQKSVNITNRHGLISQNV